LEVVEIHPIGREIYGIVEGGAYGIESKLRDVRQSREKAETIRKRPFHAEMIPFFFHFDLPEGEDKGIVALQRTGRYAIAHPFSLALAREFKKRFPSHILSLNSVMEKDILDEIASDEAELTGIHYLRHSLSSDLADGLAQNLRPAEGSIDFTVKLHESGFPLRERIREMIRGRASQSELFELVSSSVTFEFDDVKVTTRTGKKERTVNLGNPKSGFRSDYDITGQVEVSEGRPVLDSFYSVSRELISDLWKRARGSGE
jgi:hypothetical protein